MDVISGIPYSGSWTKIEPILKGWSSDKKYYVEDKLGRKFVLRLADKEVFERKQMEYDTIKLFNQLEFPMSQAVDFGVCNQGRSTYMLLTWVEGRSLEDCLLSFAIEEQYKLGVEAGRILKEIHLIPNRNNQSQWEGDKQARILTRVKDYESCPYRVEGDEAAISYVKENIGLVRDVDKVYQHGDFHIGNLIYTDEGRIGVIDFNRWNSGDYVEEFYKLQAFDREMSIPFAQGKIEGYFGATPPEAFWKRHALYVAYTSLHSIKWAIPYGRADIEGMINRCKQALEDYDGFNRFIPRWYDSNSKFF